MTGRLGGTGFSLLGWDFTNKPGKEGRIIHVVIGKSWRPQYKLMFQLTDTDGYI